MIGHLYRYPHPCDPTRFIYVGQGANRDWSHRNGKSSFGRRFKRDFPNHELPQPIRETLEIRKYSDLNEEETVWIFRYHTWHSYPNGMNLTLPGSKNYKELARMGGLVVSPNQRKVCAKLLEKYRTPEHQHKAALAGGRATAAIPEHHKNLGEKAKENRTGIFNPIFDRSKLGTVVGNKATNKKRCSEMGRKFGRIAAETDRCMRNNHIRWHLTKEILNPRCVFCSEDGLVVAYA